jgi:5-methylcytosine-specific restriction endonuclease McrA
MKNLILTLDSSGQPHHWISWQEAVTLRCKNLILWDFGDEDFMFRGGTNRASGTRTIVEVASIIALKSKFVYKPRVPSLCSRNLFRRDLNLCAYCGVRFQEKNLTKDHIIPVSRGGQNTWTNLVTACTRCNGKKDDRTPEQAGMPLLYVPYVPNKAEGLILANKSILFDQMKFLLSFVPEHSRLHTESIQNINLV